MRGRNGHVCLAMAAERLMTAFDPLRSLRVARIHHRMLARPFLFSAFICLAACDTPSWPDERFPPEVEIERTLFSKGGGAIREVCEAVVVELTDASAMRLIASTALRRDGWHPTPIVLGAGEQLYADAATGGCDNNGRRPLGDFEGALKRPGAYYRLVNGGEGLAVVVPRAKLAAWFYFG